MRRVVLCMLVAASALAPASPAEASSRLRAIPVATGLDYPATFAIAADGHVVYGELSTGEIRHYAPETGADDLLVTVPDLHTGGEQGLTGLALAGDVVYAFATRDVDAGVRSQILRFDDSTMDVLFETTAALRHNGGRLLFGPDGNLWTVVGDNEDASNAQDPSVPTGKILRLTPDGEIPADNPIPGSPVYAYGIRNAFGLAFDPQSGGLWEAENGPACNDELNRIEPGANYGWGATGFCFPLFAMPWTTNLDGPDPVQPEFSIGLRFAPTGVAFCDGCGLGDASEGTLFLGSYNTRLILRFGLSDDRSSIRRAAFAYRHTREVLSLETGLDGTLYFSDPEGIYRLAPRSAA